MKKITSILCLLALTVGLLAGCGSTSGTGGAHAILLAQTQVQLDEDAQQHIRNWLTAETGNSEAELYIIYDPPETEEATLESTAEATAEAE